MSNPTPSPSGGSKTPFLLDCPFCGQQPSFDFLEEKMLCSVYCTTGKCVNPSTGSWTTKELAIDAWNARSPELTDAHATIQALTLERDLAIAHDRQPYPTAHAYEKVCAALEKRTAERDALQYELAEVEKERDEARREIELNYDSEHYPSLSEFVGAIMDENTEMHHKVVSARAERDALAALVKVKDAALLETLKVIWSTKEQIESALSKP